MRTLDNADRVIIDPAKFTEYCLNPNNRRGKHKARAFDRALGFNLTNFGDLIEAIRRGILTEPAEFVEDTPYGSAWRVDLAITGPAGSATMRTGWIYDRGSNVPRLITAFVR